MNAQMYDIKNTQTVIISILNIDTHVHLRNIAKFGFKERKTNPCAMYSNFRLSSLIEQSIKGHKKILRIYIK